ncbi:hypothetical protein MTO96_011861 [Rhipicephalus appendiculatus]
MGKPVVRRVDLCWRQDLGRDLDRLLDSMRTVLSFGCRAPVGSGTTPRVAASSESGPNPAAGWSFGAWIPGAWALPGDVREVLVGRVEGR